jgi:hypothetical protein
MDYFEEDGTWDSGHISELSVEVVKMKFGEDGAERVRVICDLSFDFFRMISFTCPSARDATRRVIL